MRQRTADMAAPCAARPRPALIGPVPGDAGSTGRLAQLEWRQRKEPPMSSSATPRSALQSDHDILVQLNTDYINSVQRSDVKRFDEILAPEFYCSSPDGTLVDRAAFLKQTAKPVTIVNLKAEDVVIRIFSSAHDLVQEPVSTSRDH